VNLLPGMLVTEKVEAEGAQMRAAVRTISDLRFLQANLTLGLSAAGATFDPTGLASTGLRMRTKFTVISEDPPAASMRPSRPSPEPFPDSVGKIAGINRNPFWLCLFGAKADDVEDDHASWENIDRLDLTDFRYDRLSRVTDSWRVTELDRHYVILNRSRCKNWVLGWRVFWRTIEPCTPRIAEITQAVQRFRSQPDIQLSRALRSAGCDPAAKDVLAHLERNQTRYSDHGAGAQMWQWLLDAPAAPAPGNRRRR
jgi:hypothetical protein